MRFPVRRILLGFAVGAGAGWLASLLRRPKDAPAGTGADAAEQMPVEEFGEPAAPEAAEAVEPEQAEQPEPEAPHEPPRKAVPEMLTPPPGREEEPPEPEAAEAEPAKPTRPRRRKTDPKAVTDAMNEAVREGRAEVDEHLAGIEENAIPPATTRRRKP